jgi:hypothetical protein
MSHNREAWVHDIGEQVPMLPVDTILELLDSSYHSQEVAEVRGRLEKNGKLVRPNSANLESLWTDFPTKPSLTFKATKSNGDSKVHDANVSTNTSVESEDVIFKRLESVIASIKEVSEDVLSRSPETSYKADPGRRFHSLDENATFKVDGYDYLKKSTLPDTLRNRRINECDAVYVVEAKKFNSQQNFYDVSELLVAMISR